MSQIRTFLRWEVVHSSTGQAPSDTSVEAQAIRARLVDGDCRKATALAQAFPEMDPLQKIRCFLRSGDLKEAEGLLQTLSVEENLARVEVYIEQARLALFSGDWSMTHAYCLKALALQPAGTSAMTLRQLCAVSLLELGNLVESQNQVNIANSLAILYPHCGLALYVEATQIKILIQQRRFETARLRLKSAWLRLKRGPDLNVDNCVVLMRAELDLARLEQRPCAKMAYATWTLAKAAGDELYAALAVLDIYYCLASEARAEWLDDLMQSAEKFKRVRSLWQQVEGQNDNVCSSVRAIRSSSGHEVLPERGEILESVLAGLGLSIDLTNLKVSSV